MRRGIHGEVGTAPRELASLPHLAGPRPRSASGRRPRGRRWHPVTRALPEVRTALPYRVPRPRGRLVPPAHRGGLQRSPGFPIDADGVGTPEAPPCRRGSHDRRCNGASAIRTEPRWWAIAVRHGGPAALEATVTPVAAPWERPTGRKGAAPYSSRPGPLQPLRLGGGTTLTCERLRRLHLRPRGQYSSLAALDFYVVASRTTGGNSMSSPLSHQQITRSSLIEPPTEPPAAIR